MKRGLSLLLVVLFILSLSFVFAQNAIDLDRDGYDNSVDCNDNNFRIYPGAQEIKDGIDNDCDAIVDEEDNFVVDNSVSEEINTDSVANEIERDEVLESINEEYRDIDETGVTFTPDSNLYFIEKILENFRNNVANMRVKIAEIRELVKEGKFEEAKISLERLKNYANEVESNADPEMRDEARQAIAEIIKTIENIKSEIPEEYQEEFVEDVLDRSKKVAIAIEISNKIVKLCDELIHVGGYEQATEVCKLNNYNENLPKWQKEKVNEWLNTISSDGQKFFNLLEQCITGNCNCKDMPTPTQEDLCNQIKDSEENSGKQEELISQFRESLPENLREVMDKAMREFAEEEYEHSGGMPGCEDLNFRDCMLREARNHIENEAPSRCRVALLKALNQGEIKGEEDGRRICEEIMFSENKPEGCEDAENSRECASRFRSTKLNNYEFDFSACDNSELDEESELDCYHAVTESQKDYYQEKNDYRREFGDNFQGDYQDFEKRFRSEHSNEYDYQKYYEDNEDGYKRFEETKKRELTCVQSCAPDRSWNFYDGNCVCGPAREERREGLYPNQRGECPDGSRLVSSGDARFCEPDQDRRPIGNGCENVFCQEGYRCEYGNCINNNNKDYYGDGEKDRCRSNNGVPITDSRGVYTKCEYGYKEGSTDCGPGKHWDTATKIQTSQGSCVPNGCTYGVDPNTGQCASSGGSGCRINSYSCAYSTDCKNIGGYWCSASNYGVFCASSSSECPASGSGSNTVCNNNGVCETNNGESYSSCPNECASSGGTNFEGDCTRNGGTWKSNEYRCDYSGNTNTGGCSGSPSCSGGYCQNGAWVCPSTSSTSASCSSAQSWDGTKCVTISPETTTTTTSSGSTGGSDCSSQSYPSWPDCETIECVSGNYQCTKMKPTSGTTGAAITGKSVYDNPFLKYYFGR